MSVRALGLNNSTSSTASAFARSTPRIRVSALPYQSTSISDEDAIRLTLSKPIREVTTPTREEAVDAVTELDSLKKEPVENGAVTILKQVKDVISSLKKLEKTKEESLLSASQIEALTKEKEDLTKQLNEIRNSKTFTTLEKGVSLAESSIEHGQSKEALEKLRAYSGLFGKTFLKNVENGNVEGIGQVNRTLDAITELDVSGEVSSSTLGGLEESIEVAIQFFKGDQNDPDTTEDATSRTLESGINGIEGGIDLTSPFELTIALLEQIKEEPDEALEATGPLDGERALQLLF